MLACSSPTELVWFLPICFAYHLTGKGILATVNECFGQVRETEVVTPGCVDVTTTGLFYACFVFIKIYKQRYKQSTHAHSVNVRLRILRCFTYS